jgi:tetratricopeptide (TPR) repeat protein
MRPIGEIAMYFRGNFILAIAAAVILAISPAMSPVCHAQEVENDEGEAIALFHQGQDAHEKGNYRLAISLYEKALKIIPEFPEAEYQRGSAFVSVGELENAEAAFRKAIELRDDWSLAYAGLGSVLVSRDKLEEAEKILAKAIELDDLNFPAYAAIADLKIKAKRPAAEIRPLLASITALTSKSNPPASMWASRGALESALGDHRSSLASAARALEIDPRNKYALAVAVESALESADPQMAETHLRRLEIIDPVSADTKFLRARLLVANEKDDEAIRVLDSIEEPNGTVREFRDRLKAMTAADPAELERQLAEGKKDAAISGRLCTLYRVSAPAKALEHCRTAFELEPGNIGHAIGYGAAMVQARQYPQAVELLARLASVEPENSTIRANLATAYFQSKQYPNAKEQFSWLVERQPDLTAAYYFLAVTHDQLGEYLDAMANYQEYLRRADPVKDKLEIDRVTLRLPALQRQIDQRRGRRND